MSTPQEHANEPAFRIGNHAFRSRLIIGTGKYESFEQNLECARESGAEMITVALRRVNFDAAKGPRLLGEEGGAEVRPHRRDVFFPRNAPWRVRHPRPCSQRGAIPKPPVQGAAA